VRVTVPQLSLLLHRCHVKASVYGNEPCSNPSTRVCTACFNFHCHCIPYSIPRISSSCYPKYCSGNAVYLLGAGIEFLNITVETVAQNFLRSKLEGVWVEHKACLLDWLSG
jgi:hypothetical protein